MGERMGEEEAAVEETRVAARRGRGGPGRVPTRRARAKPTARMEEVREPTAVEASTSHRPWPRNK